MCDCHGCNRTQVIERDNSFAVKAVAVAERAYIALLRTGPYHRTRLQEELCLLRDFIADSRPDLGAEGVQDLYEAKAAGRA